ncbi:hypothetical protein DO021_19265 [Desulfobacter hydrogenophilus]|uniref:Uncharacterized protein n=1 Tax=Desulfobacter hydrogenophilus TaxID=2291 RepID=A0A328FAH6_9BACT|nr:hypothetical protein [Desulfobacter hydrogenophilus]NDY74259.1 hypothetical protein [Desulfobacter hydrogenophilus]QBH14591.1 hypothetical protein EYB58_17670 [Desulfobacter hydrogenophilus]RAM00422.1 hypothetical protein DO021_19265 [Desulfobacter hydrogenophilus]
MPEEKTKGITPEIIEENSWRLQTFFFNIKAEKKNCQSVKETDTNDDFFVFMHIIIYSWILNEQSS